jgi:hypothetical protein
MSSENQINSSWIAPTATPLNETLWLAWLAKGRVIERRKRAEMRVLVSIVSSAVLLVGAGVWSHLLGYDVVVRFAVALGALFITSRAIQSADYLLAGIFGTMALLYNPVAPVFSFSGNWQRGFVVGSALLFIASIYWPAREARHA